MSIIGKVGSKSRKVKTLNTIIHIVLLLGSVTMIYPFLLMLSSSIKSAVDSNRMSIIPDYLFNDKVLFQKYIESRYNEESSRLSENYAGRYFSFQEVQPPESGKSRVFLDWLQFMQKAKFRYDVYDYYVSEQYGRGVYPYNQRQIRNQLRKETKNDLLEFNRHYGTGVQAWEQIVIEEKDIHSRNFVSSKDGYLGRYRQFKESTPWYHRNYINFDGNFVMMELFPAFGGDLVALNQTLNKNYNSWNEIQFTSTCPNDKLRPYWFHYVKEILNIHQIQLSKEALPYFRNMLKTKYEKIDLLNLTWHTSYQRFEEIDLPRKLPDSGALIEDLTYFVENLAKPEHLQVSTINEDFRFWLYSQYGIITNLNLTWDLGYKKFWEIRLPSLPPKDNLQMLCDWKEYVLKDGISYLKIKSSAQTDFLNYLRRRYPNKKQGIDLVKVQQVTGNKYEQEEDIFPAERLPRLSSYRDIWTDFAKKDLSVKYMSIDTTKSAILGFRQYLLKKYKTINQLNLAWHLKYVDFADIVFPQAEIDYYTFYERRTAIRWEFLTRNYIMVLDQMLRDAKSLKNTFIYCLLSIFLAITVNPLAAYALSRFKPRFTYQILMLFMLTMAFPAMVIGIPNFLMLKKLNLLNTFWALVLPAAADGYFIFLLKGFFDSLPRELYESARLDGAGEFRMFWQFTLYLSKPILAVIALNAFNAAYRNFLFAFIVCQDQSMWTLMVHIYELMQRASNSVGYAALVIAAIPTLAVFVFFQNIIIKGIVVPMEK